MRVGWERRRRRPFPGRTLYYGTQYIGARVAVLSSPYGFAYFIPLRYKCIAPIIEREVLRRDGWLIEVHGVDRVVVVTSIKPAPPPQGEVEWPAAWS